MSRTKFLFAYLLVGWLTVAVACKSAPEDFPVSTTSAIMLLDGAISDASVSTSPRVMMSSCGEVSLGGTQSIERALAGGGVRVLSVRNPALGEERRHSTTTNANGSLSVMLRPLRFTTISPLDARGEVRAPLYLVETVIQHVHPVSGEVSFAEPRQSDVFRVLADASTEGAEYVAIGYPVRDVLLVKYLIPVHGRELVLPSGFRLDVGVLQRMAEAAPR